MVAVLLAVGVAAFSSLSDSVPAADAAGCTIDFNNDGNFKINGSSTSYKGDMVLSSSGFNGGGSGTYIYTRGTVTLGATQTATITLLDGSTYDQVIKYPLAYGGSYTKVSSSLDVTLTGTTSTYGVWVEPGATVSITLDNLTMNSNRVYWYAKYLWSNWHDVGAIKAEPTNLKESQVAKYPACINVSSAYVSMYLKGENHITQNAGHPNTTDNASEFAACAIEKRRP